FPQFDPHGDPIPDSEGSLKKLTNKTLASARQDEEFEVIAVKETATEFLQHLEKIGVQIGAVVKVNEILPFDNSMSVNIDGKAAQTLSGFIAANLIVKEK